LEDSLDEMVQVNKCLKVLEYFLEKGSQWLLTNKAHVVNWYWFEISHWS
jgi:hypothetical protein